MVSLLFAALGFAVAASAGQTPSTDAKPSVQAFQQYEAIRVALSSDNLKDASARAKDLAGSSHGVGGDVAKKAAQQIGSAATIEDARTRFGELSAILVPIFQADAIPGVTAYVCPMKKTTWAQTAGTIQNPYYGKAMATCGTALPGKAK